MKEPRWRKKESETSRPRPPHQATNLRAARAGNREGSRRGGSHKIQNSKRATKENPPTPASEPVSLPTSKTPRTGQAASRITSPTTTKKAPTKRTKKNPSPRRSSQHAALGERRVSHGLFSSLASFSISLFPFRAPPSLLLLLLAPRLTPPPVNFRSGRGSGFPLPLLGTHRSLRLRPIT